MFAELREALACCRALDKAKDSRSRHKHLRQPVLVVQFLFEASDLATEVTPKPGGGGGGGAPKVNSTCENEAEGAQRRPSTKRALFFDQYSELDDEIASLISRADKNPAKT